MSAPGNDIRVIPPRRIRNAFDLPHLTYPSMAGRIIVDLQEVEWISPVGVVGLLAMCKRGIEDRTIQGMVVIAPHAELPLHYLGAIGFFSAVEEMGGHIESGSDAQRFGHNIRPCLPVTHVRTEGEADAALDRLVDVLQEARTHPQYIDHIYIAFSEMTVNAWEHGSRPSYIVAQTHSRETSKTPGVHLAVADFGPGFLATLQGSYHVQDESAALQRAFEAGVSGTGDPLRGQGLNHVMESIDALPGAELRIVSGDGLISRERRMFNVHHVRDCQGVFAELYIPFDFSR